MLQTHPSALLTPPSWYSRHTPFLYSTQMLYKIITAYHIWIYGSQVDAPTIVSNKKTLLILDISSF